MDTVTREVRSRIMSRIRGKDTKPEMTVRRLAHSLGYRFRLHRRDLPGTPDLVFPRLRAVIFVNGCFWHQHSCKLGKIPKSNVEFWTRKFERNTANDRKNAAALRADGWRVLVVWECEMARNDWHGSKGGRLLTQKLADFLSQCDLLSHKKTLLKRKNTSNIAHC